MDGGTKTDRNRGLTNLFKNVSLSLKECLNYVCYQFPSYRN